MAAKLKTWITNFFTEKDGVTPDFIRVTGLGSLVWYMGAATTDLYVHSRFDPQGLAGGLAMLIGAMAGGMAARSATRDTSTT